MNAQGFLTHDEIWSTFWRWYEATDRPHSEQQAESQVRQAQKAYANGHIGIEQLEHRLDRALGWYVSQQPK